MKIKITDISSVGATTGQVPRVSDSGSLEWGDAAGGGSVETYATAAYWRIKATSDATAGAGFFAVGELQFLDSDGVNRATGGSSISSSVYSGSWPSSNAYDGNTSSSWISANGSVKNEWVGYNFGTPVSVRTVRLCPSSDFLNGLPSSVLIEYSTDNGTTWNATDTILPGQGVSGTYQVFQVSKILGEGSPLAIPDTTGNAGKILAVTSNAADVEWIDAPSGGGSGSGLPSGGVENQILVSNGSGGGTWQTPENGLGGGPSVTEPYGKHSYWRIVHLGGTHASYVVHTELEMRSTPDGITVTAGGTPIQSGNYGTNVAANAFDGVSSTYWESNNTSLSGGGNWLGYQFAAPVSITEIVSVQNGSEPNERVTAGKIQYSDDGTTWVDAWSFSGWNTDLVGSNTTTSPDIHGPTDPYWLVPGGGTTGQVLAKNSVLDGDFEWADQTGGSGSGSKTETIDAISGFFGIYGSAGADDTTAYAAKGTSATLLQDVEIDGVYGFTSIASGQSVRGFVAEINTTTNAIVGTVYYTPNIAYNAGGTYYSKLTNVVRFNAGTTLVVGFIRMDSTGTTSLNFPGSNTAKMLAPVAMLNYQYRWNTTSLTDGQVASSNNSSGTYPVTIVGRAVSSAAYNGSTEADLVAVPTRVAARYWRVIAPADVVSSDSWIGIGELKWLSNTDLNLATGGTAFASGQYDGSWTPAKAFDGSLADNSGWISTNGQKAYQWLGYDFGTAVTPYKFSIAPISNYAGTLPSKLNVEFSFDGISWFYVSQSTINRTPGAGVYQDFSIPVYVNPNTVGLTVKNYESRIIRTSPTFMQKATLRNDGVLTLTNTPTVGNLLVLVVAGFDGSISAYIPSGFGISARYNSNTNNVVAVYTKTVTSGDTGSFTMSASDNQQAIMYEYKDATGIMPIGGGTISVNGSTGTISVPTNPFSINSPILLAIEHDTSVKIDFTDNLNLTKDYAATDSSNHKGAFARYVGEGGTITVSADGAFTSPVWGAYALLGKQIAYNANDVVKLPSGGTTGQVLTKNSNTTNDIAWTTSLQEAPIDGKPYVRKDGAWVAYTPTENIIIAVGDETTPITVGASKVTFRMPYAFKLSSVRASLTVASNTGDVVVDINEAGTTILSTKLSLDATEKTSTTAAVPVVISDINLADDSEITIDIDSSGSGAIGLKIALIGTRVL